MRIINRDPDVVWHTTKIFRHREALRKLADNRSPKPFRRLMASLAAIQLAKM